MSSSTERQHVSTRTQSAHGLDASAPSFVPGSETVSPLDTSTAPFEYYRCQYPVLISHMISDSTPSEMFFPGPDDHTFRSEGSTMSRQQSYDSTEASAHYHQKARETAIKAHLGMIDRSKQLFGADVRNWPISARMQLNFELPITLELSTEEGFYYIELPVAPLMAVSPHTHQILQNHPKTECIPFHAPSITPTSIQNISHWLWHLCTHEKISNLGVPLYRGASWQDLLLLRMTALQLDMSLYLTPLEQYYITNMSNRALDLDEARIIAQSACSNNDVLLVAFANCLGYLVRYGKLLEEVEMRLLRVLGGEEWSGLVGSVREEGVRRLARQSLGLFE